MESKIITDKQELDIILNNEGFNVLDIEEFLQEHYQNKLNVKSNKENFLKFIDLIDKNN